MELSSTRLPQETAKKLTRWQQWLGLGQPAIGASHSDVELVAGPTRTFADETALLLRSRLQAYALVNLAMLCFFFALSWFVFVDHILLGFRIAAILVVAACYAAVRWRQGLTARALHGLELALLLDLVAYIATMMTGRIIHFANAGDVISLTAVQQGYMGGWVLLVLTYGLFIPMPWRRAAAQLLPIGCAPEVLLTGLRCFRADVSSVFARDQEYGFSVLPLVAAVAAVYAAHLIYRTRQIAFEGRRFGQYVLAERIGGGGMGEVFRADHLLLKRPCAVKLIRPDRSLDEQTIERFEAEVRATARLSHCNTVEIYDFGRAADGTLYYVMELLRGMNLDQLVKEFGPLLPERVVYLLRQICGALGEAHASGMVHRDIKPSNIFAAERGGMYDFAKLLDFGLVRQGGVDPVADLSSFGGSPQYMAPEQFSDYATADVRSDIYAVGAVGYFLLIGRPPFGGRWIKELHAAHAHQAATRPSLLRPSVPLDLEEVLLRCLAKAPADRFSSAESLRAALDACSCASGWTAEQARQWWREHPPGSAQGQCASVETVA
jgi:serine/threonine-protein kinase